jgi:hypothetical protein
MVLFCFSCSTPCKTRQGLTRHLKSRPACLDELGISRASNWGSTLGLPSVTTSSNAINKHNFPVEPDPKLVAKRPVEVMWQDKQDSFSASSVADTETPLKSLKGSSNASIRGPGSRTRIIIEHRCGSKTIEMVIDDDSASSLLKDLLLSNNADSKAATLSLEQIHHLQRLMDPANEEIFSDDEQSVPGDGHDFWEIPPPVDNMPNNHFNLEEERMFENAKMYTDRGNGCFTNKEILSIRLLGIMREIGAPLKTYGRIVSLFKDVITERVAITSTFRHRHTAIKHFSDRFCMKKLYPTVLTQTSPFNNRFYPVPVHDAKAMIESLLYSSLAKDDSNLLFPNPEDPLAPPPP